MSQFKGVDDGIFIDPQPTKQDLDDANLIHCATGARVALQLSLSKVRQHDWTIEQAFAEAKRIGFDLKTSPKFSTFVAQTMQLEQALTR